MKCYVMKNQKLSPAKLGAVLCVVELARVTMFFTGVIRNQIVFKNYFFEVIIKKSISFGLLGVHSNNAIVNWNLLVFL